MSSNTTRRERMAALAAEHVRAEDAGDVDATLATFHADAAFELFPCGLRLSGHAAPATPRAARKKAMTAWRWR